MTVNNYPETNAKLIWDFLKGKGLNDFACAGVLGNLYAESKLKPNNLQNSAEIRLGLDDETYTAAVDCRAYGNFVDDKAGYGLAQWTSSGRKAGLLNLVKSTGRSIGDINAQLEYLWNELNGAYKTKVLDVLLTADSVRKAAEVFVVKFEVPASVIKGGSSKENTINTRTDYAQDFYDLYTNKSEVDNVGLAIKQCILTKNDCYKENRIIKPAHIVVHSTGANNKSIKRYVQPDDGVLGVNLYKNDWNRSGVNKCVHAFIGEDKNGVVRIYQTLPWTMRPWGCGSGKSGSYNNNAIQFEICEDNLKNAAYFNEVMDKAISLCALLCKTYNIPVTEVVSHHEAYLRGYASNHGDIDHWLKIYGKTMDWFRGCVAAKLTAVAPEKNEPVQTDTSYKVRVTASVLNIRAGAGITYKVVGTIKDKGVYTIVETKGTWGKLKSGAGWISLLYTKRV